MKGLKKGLILISILIVPSLAYILLSSGKHHFKHLPHFFPVEPILGKDTIFQKLPSFSFRNQEGKIISDSSLSGKTIIADFFFTTCPSICPKKTGELNRVQEKFAAQRDIRLISFSVDPVKDSIPALYDYGKAHMIKPGKWHLLTGPKEEIYKLATGFFHLPVDQSGRDFVHSEQAALIDKHGVIRGFYDATNPREVDRLIDEIRVLELEYKEDQKKGGH